MKAKKTEEERKVNEKQILNKKERIRKKNESYPHPHAKKKKFKKGIRNKRENKIKDEK